MIIKVMPENDNEKRRIQEVEHTGVSEFFMFGNKKDEDGEMVDFHDWSGSYRYLVGSLYYFLKSLSSEQQSKLKANVPEISFKPQKSTPITKNIDGGEIEQVITAENLQKEINNDEPQKENKEAPVIKFPDLSK